MAAGSIAAGMQGPAIAAGSKFALFQSVGAAWTLLSPPVLITAALTGAAVGVGAYALGNGGWKPVK